MAKSPLSCCLSASLVFEVQFIENEQEDALRSQHFGEVRSVLACLPVGGLQGAQAQPDQPTEAQQINRGSPQPLPNYTHWAGSHFGYFACSDTSDQKKQKDSILELQENVGML